MTDISLQMPGRVIRQKTIVLSNHSAMVVQDSNLSYGGRSVKSSLGNVDFASREKKKRLGRQLSTRLLTGCSQVIEYISQICTTLSLTPRLEKKITFIYLFPNHIPSCCQLSPKQGDPSSPGRPSASRLLLLLLREALELLSRPELPVEVAFRLQEPELT